MDLTVLSEQVTNFIKSSVLGSYHIFYITSTTADLDAKYEASLGFLALDLEGKLVQTFTLLGTSFSSSLTAQVVNLVIPLALFQLLRAPWTAFALEWVGKCNTNGDC